MVAGSRVVGDRIWLIENYGLQKIVVQFWKKSLSLQHIYGIIQEEILIKNRYGIYATKH